MYSQIPGCCGRSEDTTSWGLIIGTIFFSIVYNFSRFFEFNVKWITDEFQYNNKTGEEFYGELLAHMNPDDFVAFNKSFWFVELFRAVIREYGKNSAFASLRWLAQTRTPFQ